MKAPRDLRPIHELAPLVRAGALSPVDLVRTCFSRIDERPELNAFITLLRERALDEARAAEQEISAGRYLGPLHGIPISVKDLVDIAGTRTTAGSHVPAGIAAEDAPVVKRLRHAGAIDVGKAKLQEFAFGTTSDETAFGPARHPEDVTRSPGGSSGGSAAAVHAGMCFASVGTDTGGSIRIPAAACGIVGLKPTLGEIPCDGVVALSATLDHVGPMTRSVIDAGLMFQAMKGVSIHGIAPAGGRLVFGVPRPFFFDRLEAGARRAVETAMTRMREAGYSLQDAPIEHAEWTPDVYLHIVLPEASFHHARGLDDYPDKYSPGVRLRLEMGRYLLAEDYVRAMNLKQELTHAVDRALERCDALVLPTLPIPAPRVGSVTVDVDGVQTPVRAAMLRLTQLFDITGHPAIALPAGRGPEGLPRSVQLVGHRGRTERLLDIAAALEQVIH